MALFRLPQKHLPMFKALCNTTIKHLDLKQKNKVPLLGRKLYNAFSRALGHRDFNSLLQDSNKYTDGVFDWDGFYKRLESGLRSEFGESVDVMDVQVALGGACSELSEEYEAIQGRGFPRSSSDGFGVDMILETARKLSSDNDILRIKYLSGAATSNTCTPPHKNNSTEIGMKEYLDQSPVMSINLGDSPEANELATSSFIKPLIERQEKEIEVERRRLRQLLDKTGSSLISSICEHKIADEISGNGRYEFHCLVCGYRIAPDSNHSFISPTPGDFEIANYLAGGKPKQPVYYIAVDHMKAIVNEAGNKYSGYDFGESNDDEVLEKLLALRDTTYESYIKLSRATTLLSSLKTGKMLGWANSGLNDIMRALNARRMPR